MIESFKLPVITPETLTGSIVSFKDEYGGLPLKSCTSLISGYQEGSGISSPQNERPLHAFSSANLPASGKNLFDKCEFTDWVVYGSYLLLKNRLPDAQLIMSFSDKDTSVDVSGIYFGFFSNDYESGAPTQYRWCLNNGNIESNTTNVYTGINLGALAIYPRTEETFNKLFARYNIQIELGSTATDYEAYNGNIYTFTFGTDIYSGYIDWKRGVVVGTWGMDDLGSMTYYEAGSTDTVTQYYTTGLDSTAKSFANTACSIYERNATKNEWTVWIIATGSSGRTYMRTPKDYYSDATAFKTAMDGVMLAYELATPIEIPLGGINLLTQEGQNNIFCDTGNTEVTHLKVT